MKLAYKSIAFAFVIALSSCDFKKDTPPQDIDLQEEKTDTIVAKPEKKYALATQNNWEKYYSQKDSGFDMSNFEKEESFKIVRMESQSTPIWSQDFNPVYKDFFAFNADSTQYVDIHSYKWNFDDNGELIIGPDQEIVLVDIPNKKSERILFYGPSFWVEDAYFKNDSIVVLLENSTDKTPAYQEINLNQNLSQYYIYKEPLNFDSDYLKNKISEIYTDPM